MDINYGPQGVQMSESAMAYGASAGGGYEMAAATGMAAGGGMYGGGAMAAGGGVAYGGGMSAGGIPAPGGPGGAFAVQGTLVGVDANHDGAIQRNEMGFIAGGGMGGAGGG